MDKQVLLKVNANQENPVCSIVSVQPLENCLDEVYDEEKDMRYGDSTVFQTMLRVAAIVIDKKTYPNGVNIVLLAKSSDSGCYLKTMPNDKSSDRSMAVTVSVERMTEDPALSTLIVLMTYILISLVSVSVSFFSFKRFGMEYDSQFGTYERNLEQQLINNSENADESTIGKDNGIFMKMVNMFYTTSSETENENLLPSTVMMPRQPSPSENEQTSGAQIKRVVTLDLTEISRKRANRAEVTVADMAVYYNKEYFPNFLKLRSELFLWLIILVGIYYTLPVFQLVYYYQETAIISGNLDTCYYNYFCLYPWGPLADYGHVFSNIGYVISGLTFMLIVKHRSYKYHKLCTNTKLCEEHLGLNHPRLTGVPETFGIFYALGAALAFEGLLSGCYHVCPTAENFQFDTTFMYVIAVLVFLKVYQFRHLDITQTAHLVFLVIGFALILEVIGIFTSSLIFWIIFVIIYITFVISFISHVYYNGTGISFTQRLIKVLAYVKSLFQGQHRKLCAFSMNKKLLLQLIPIFWILFINIGMAGFFLYKRKPGVSRYILAIMMVNMALYVIYYISNKMFYRFRTTGKKPSEGLRIVTCLYGVASLLFMTGAATFFIFELKTSAGTPAESRNLNASCFILIFDNHDMWHFLSAAGLFYLFMFILTLEDLNMEQPRNKIPVF